MSHYKPYPVYKDSGVEWLGRVPEHWRQVPLKHLILSISQGWSPECEGRSAEADEWGVVKVSCVNGGQFRPAENKALPSSLKSRPELSLRKGDVLVSRANTRELVGSCAVVPKNYPKLLLCDKIYRIVCGVKVLPDFLAALITVHGRRAVEIEANGASASMVNIAQSVILNLPVAIPDTSEQDGIIVTVERETACIDALIEKKSRFVELLREKRQALISRAVTKGLNPEVKMKQSGMEWLGDVPEHWSVCKLSFRYSVELGKMLDEKRITGTSLTPYLRNQDVQWDVINTKDLPEMDIYPEEFSRYTIQHGDLLVCEGGDVGRASIWRGNDAAFGYQKALHRLRARYPERDTAEFFFFALIAAKTQGVFEESDSSATIAHLPAEKFRQYRFAFPPPSEQAQIATFIRSQSGRIDNVLGKTERSINLLKERRSALITAAVTGQIDLREAV